MKIAALSLLSLAAMALFAPSQARAVEPLDTFSFRVGGYITSWDTEVRADGTYARGTELDLKRDFGLDDSATIGYVGVTWRPWERHEFGLTYYQDDADSTRMITRDITFEDTTYTANRHAQRRCRHRCVRGLLRLVGRAEGKLVARPACRVDLVSARHRDGACRSMPGGNVAGGAFPRGSESRPAVADHRRRMALDTGRSRQMAHRRRTRVTSGRTSTISTAM
jgi:hypothetical protein